MIRAVLAMMCGKSERIAPNGSAPGLPDPGDARFLQCAVAAEAEYIVIGNKRRFPQDEYGAVHVVSAGELLDRITPRL